MFWLSMLRIFIVIVSTIIFYRLTTRLIKIPLKGFRTIWAGIALFVCNAVVGSTFHNLSPELIDQYAFLVPLGLTFRYALLPIGCILLLYGAYRLLASLQEHLKPRYEALVERSLVGVFRVEDKKITYANPRFAEIFGDSRANLVGIELSEIVHPEDIQNVQSAIDTCLSDEGKTINIEFRAMHHTGREIQVQALGDCFATVDGKAFQATMQEITERVRFAEQMRKSEERYRRLLEHSQETVIIHDMGNIEFVNPSGARLLVAKDEKSLIGKNLLDFFPADIQDDMNRHFHDIHDNDAQEFLSELKMIRSDGRTAFVEMRSLPFPNDGKKSIQTLIRDNTERKAASDLLTGQKHLLESMARGNPLAEILNEIAEFIKKQIPETSCSISLCDDNREVISLVAESGLNQTLKQTMSVLSCEAGNGPFVSAIQEQKLVTSESIANNPEWKNLADTALRVDIVSSCAMPVFSQQDVAVGAITVYSKEQFLPTMRDIELLSIAADMVGVAYENNQLEAASILNEARYRRLFSGINDLVCVFPLTAEGIGTIIEVNDVACTTLGYSSDELMKMHPRELFLKTDYPKLEEHLLLLRKNKKVLLELSCITKDGDQIPLEVNSQSFELNGQETVLAIGRDISERKEAERILREKEERFRSLVQYSSDIVTVLNSDGKITYISPSVTKLLGFDAEDVLGQTVYGFVHEEDLNNLQEAFQRLNEEPEFHGPFEYRFRHRDGHSVYLEAMASNLLDNPSIGGIVVNSRDITDRKIVQIALLESEERFRTIFDNAGIGIMLILTDGSIMVSNVAMREMLGLQNSSMRGLFFRDFYSENSGMPKHEELLATLENTEGMHQFDCKLGRTESNKISVHVTASLVKNSDQQTQFIILMAEDVTERNNALRALVEEKERLSVTLKSIGDGVIAVDNMNRIILANEVAGRLLDCNPEQIIGKPLQSVLKEGELSTGEFLHRLEKDSNTAIHRAPMEITRENGRKHKINATLSAMFDEDKQRIGSVIVLRDVTSEVALEEELRRTQKLESLGILAGGIAHDFNNILTAIIGNISLGKLSLSEQHAVSLRLDDAERAAVRARDLTQQLLTFAKGGAPIKRAASIAEIIRETAGFVLRGNRAKCEYHFAPDIWNVEVDEGQISQVINNLVINGAQSMPNGGTIHILCENFEALDNVRYRNIFLTPGNYVRIVVGDEGVGIPKEYLEQVFDPYFTTKQKGSGLGLATSYSIIKKHEGYIFVESDYQKGSEFTILLPAKPGLEVNNPKENQAVHGGNGKILVMDDEVTILEVAEAMLTRLGYETVLCRDGGEAIEAYHQAIREAAPFKAVIADLTVPGGIGGKEMVATLRETYPDLLALVSSGYSNDPIMAEFQKHGFQGRILKPYNVQILGSALKDVLDNQHSEPLKKTITKN